MSADLKTLQARVAEAKGADRALDRDLHLAFGLYPAGIEDFGCYHDPAEGCVSGRSYQAPTYTASLDAALALCERVLPGKVSEILHAAWKQVSTTYQLHLRRWSPEWGPYSQAVARWVIAALLAALNAEQTTEEGR